MGGAIIGTLRPNATENGVLMGLCMVSEGVAIARFRKILARVFAAKALRAATENDSICGTLRYQKSEGVSN